jgi:hypothetical protein
MFLKMKRKKQVEANLKARVLYMNLTGKFERNVFFRETHLSMSLSQNHHSSCIVHEMMGF